MTVARATLMLMIHFSALASSKKNNRIIEAELVDAVDETMGKLQVRLQDYCNERHFSQTVYVTRSGPNDQVAWIENEFTDVPDKTTINNVASLIQDHLQTYCQKEGIGIVRAQLTITLEQSRTDRVETQWNYRYYTTKNHEVDLQPTANTTQKEETIAKMKELIATRDAHIDALEREVKNLEGKLAYTTIDIGRERINKRKL